MSRKALRICNRPPRSASKGGARIAFAVSLGLAAGVTLPAQSKKADAAQNPPSVTMPAMPSVSMPSVGSGFYAPGRSDFYTGARTNQNQNQAKTASKSDTQATQTDESVSSTADENQSAAQNTNLQAARNLSSLSNSASASLNQLTAEDISSMSSLGVFSQLSGLLGRGNASLQNQILASQNTITAGTADSAALRQILSELTELKNQMGGGGADSVTKKSAGEDAFTSTVKKEPKILRFIVNGYDILSTCKKIYFSDLETDGTFLLTGDRKYISENKVRSETFYFYFHTSGSENGITKYAVTPAVSQDYENQYSYLYQLTQKDALTADRTGNLVTLRARDGEWSMDLLISLDR